MHCTGCGLLSKLSAPVSQNSQLTTVVQSAFWGTNPKSQKEVPLLSLCIYSCVAYVMQKGWAA